MRRNPILTKFYATETDYITLHSYTIGDNENVLGNHRHLANLILLWYRGCVREKNLPLVWSDRFDIVDFCPMWLQGLVPCKYELDRPRHN